MYGSPGYAISQELEGILAQKRAEKQQDFINKLAQDRESRELETSRENLRTLAAQREASVEAAHAAAAEKFGRITKRGTLVSDEDYKRLAGIGLGSNFSDTELPGNRPSVSTEEQFTQPGESGEVDENGGPIITPAPPASALKKGHYWMGDRSDQEEEDRQGMISGILSNPEMMKKISGMSPAEYFLTMQKIDPKGTIPAGVFAQRKPDTERFIIVHPDGNMFWEDNKTKVTGPIPTGTQRIMLPSPPSGTNSLPVQALDGNGKPIPGVFVYSDNHTLKMAKLGDDVPKDLITGKQPTEAKQDLPLALLKEYQKAIELAKPVGGLLSVGPGKIDPTILAKKEGLASEVIRQYPMSSTARDAVQQLWFSRDKKGQFDMRNTDVSQIPAMFAGSDGTQMTPSELAEITSLLLILRGK